MAAAPTLKITARWAVVDAQHVLADAAILLRQDRIVWIGPRARAPAAGEIRTIDLPDCALMPGLVNAHAHLDLTSLGGAVPGEGGLLPWLLRLIPQRARLTEDRIADGVRRGASLSLAGGATTVADIDSFGRAASVLASCGLRVVALRELLGTSADAIERGAALAEEWLRQQGPPLLQAGLSPHAPYSVGADLLLRARALAAAHGALLATHVAETREECELLERGTGPFAEFLAQLGAPPFASPRRRPLAWLWELGILSRRFLAVHSNYLDEAEIAALAATGASVVYCPRSHAYFGHERHPVAALRARGVNVALGTDSLASNQSLGMLDEMAFLHRVRPDLGAPAVLEMATLGGARALGLEAGALRAGWLADLIAVAPDECDAPDPVLAVVSGAVRLVLSVVAGVPRLTDPASGQALPGTWSR